MSSCQDELFNRDDTDHKVIAKINKLHRKGVLVEEIEKVDAAVRGDHDPVNHPKHYNKGKIEVADFIADQELNFDRGNAVKYICRAGDKGDAELSPTQKAIQDLEKAIWYLKHEINWIRTHGIPGT